MRRRVSTVPAPEARELPRTKILLVDDHAENLVALEASLEPLGALIVCARSGTEALRAVLDEQFAVILMDIKMPGLDGFETLALLKQRERSRDVPIIFLSGFPEAHHVLRSYSSGAVDYLLKPIDPDALRSKVSVFMSLHAKELAIQAAHAEVEQRVQQRTAELAAANSALEREIAERKTAEQRLFELAHRDALTGLAHRRVLVEELNRAIARWQRGTSPRFAVMWIDIDRFKSINDRLGHLAGDRLLVDIADRLRRCLRDVDIPARLGGDEFAVLLDGVTSTEDAMRMAGRVQRALAAPSLIDDKQVLATASIGIALIDDRYTCGEDLLSDADVAMYRAKREGRARSLVFDEEMHASVLVRRRLEADLSGAIERNELVLHYQPIVDVGSTALVGFEALLRWQHPERGLVGPAAFISQAEDTGLIRPIGQWVLEQACRQLAAWGSVNPRLTMSVNLSTCQFAQSDLSTTIGRTIENAQIDPKRLILEITESAILPGADYIAETLSRLQRLGVAISLDDFGTGYSCLSYLDRLPVSSVKIDRSFVQRIDASNDRPDLVRAIIALAHNLGISATAEGVETEAQLQRLRQFECERAQGYLFARPLDASAAERFLRDQTRSGAVPGGGS